MTRFLSLRSRWLPLAVLVMGITAVSLAAPRAASADHDDHWEHHWRPHDRDGWGWRHGYGAYRYAAPRYYARWSAPVYLTPPPPPYYAVVPAVPRYVVAPSPPVVVVPALPRIVFPIGRHGAVIFGP